MEPFITYSWDSVGRKIAHSVVNAREANERIAKLEDALRLVIGAEDYDAIEEAKYAARDALGASHEDDDPPCCTRCHIVCHEPYDWAEIALGDWLCEACGAEVRKAEVL